jgi:leucine dehydrogenase
VQEGARVVVTEIDSEKLKCAVAQFNVTSVAPAEIYKQDADIFAPYAMGAVINDETIPQLRVKVIAGSANNILADERHGDELERRGIVYAVDYIANSGGTIYDTDRLRKGGFQKDRASANVRKIFCRIEEVFQLADRDHIPYYKAADRLAEQRIAALKGIRLLTPDPLPLTRKPFAMAETTAHGTNEAR